MHSFNSWDRRRENHFVILEQLWWSPSQQYCGVSFWFAGNVQTPFLSTIFKPSHRAKAQFLIWTTLDGIFISRNVEWSKAPSFIEITFYPFSNKTYSRFSFHEKEEVPIYRIDFGMINELKILLTKTRTSKEDSFVSDFPNTTVWSS